MKKRLEMMIPERTFVKSLGRVAVQDAAHVHAHGPRPLSESLDAPHSVISLLPTQKKVAAMFKRILQISFKAFQKQAFFNLKKMCCEL